MKNFSRPEGNGMKQPSGDYNKEMQRSLQNQFAREDKQKLMGVNMDDPSEITARTPDMPDIGEKVLCMMCGHEIPPTRDGVPQKIVDRERKFRVCQNCRGQIVGSGGMLDRSTPNLQQERNFK